MPLLLPYFWIRYNSYAWKDKNSVHAKETRDSLGLNTTQCNAIRYSTLFNAWRKRLATMQQVYMFHIYNNKLTSIAFWHGGRLRSKLLSRTVFPLHLKSVWWHSLRSCSLSPQIMWITITLSSWLGRKPFCLKSFIFPQFVFGPQISTWSEKYI